jgi:CRISPR-associated protein Csm3
MRLVAKLFIKGKIQAVTGLHIGGSKSSLDIGGVDLNVIKTHDGIPFIPGSSLKGKLRSMLARAEGSMAISANRKDKEEGLKTDQDVPYILQLFGSSADSQKSDDVHEISRLIVRDAYLLKEVSPKQDDHPEMDYEYTDVKFENTIDRKKGVAQHPRQLERVPAGACFELDIVYDIYKEDEEETYLPKADVIVQAGRTRVEQHLWALRTAMQLLQDDYLGGQGTRGYGKIIFKDIHVIQKRFSQDTTYGSEKLNGLFEAFSVQLKELA